MLTSEAAECFERAVLCWLATSDAAGRPTVSPKEIFVVGSPEELLIADIASPKSVRNLADRPEVCVAAIDVFEQRGFQAYGEARVVSPRATGFPALAEPLVALAGPDFPIRSVIAVRVERCSPILAPSLWMRPGVPAADRRASALAAYGVRDR
jgi:uncharacterized protein